MSLAPCQSRSLKTLSDGIVLYLCRPIYRETAKNGHFGNPAFGWEKTDRAKELQA